MRRAQKQIILSLGLSGLAALLLAASLWLRSTDKAAAPNEDKKTQQLFALHEVQALGYSGRDFSISISQKGDDWVIRDSAHVATSYPCHPIILARVLDDFSDIHFERVLVNISPSADAGLNNKQFGLLKPRLSWTAELGDEKRVSLKIGARNPMNGLIYIETQDRNGHKRIGLIKSHAISGLDIDAAKLRDRRLLKLKKQSIGRLLFHLDGGQQLELFHDGAQDAPWRSKQALQPDQKIRQNAVAQILQSLQRSQWGQKWTVNDGAEKPLGFAIGWNQARSLLIYDDQQKLLAELRISPLYQKNYYLWRVDKNVLYRVQGRGLDQWPRQVDDLVEGKPNSASEQ